MYCPNCGTYNDETYNNCIACGKYIADINKEITRKNETSNAAVRQETEHNDENNADSYVKTETVNTEPATPINNENVNSYNTAARNYADTVYRQNIKKPKDYFVLSIICALLGSLSFGIAALIFSGMTRAENEINNLRKASIYSDKARMFCIFSVIIGILKYLFIIILFVYNYFRFRYYGPYIW